MTMLPSEREKEMINEKVGEFPDRCLGQAEQFLMLLAEVPNVLPRLKLWLFMLDYANIEKVRFLLKQRNNGLMQKPLTCIISRGLR